MSLAPRLVQAVQGDRRPDREGGLNPGRGSEKHDEGKRDEGREEEDCCAEARRVMPAQAQAGWSAPRPKRPRVPSSDRQERRSRGCLPDRAGGKRNRNPRREMLNSDQNEESVR